MTEANTLFLHDDLLARRKTAIGLTAIFITQFVSFLFINARNIAQPQMIADLDGMTLFSWLIALPALSGAASTLLFGKLSDMYGRRVILLISMTIFGIGLVFSAQATTMPLLIASTTFMSIGHFPIVPLCFTVVGDLFSAAERAKWTGLLNLPAGVAALLGPVMGGFIAESPIGWRGLYWGAVPLVFIAGALIIAALPKRIEPVKSKIDAWGAIIMVIATTTLIVGFSWLNAPDRLGMGAMLLLFSLGAWIAFIYVETRVEAPILAPQVLFNRPFATAAGAGVLSIFGFLGIVAYSPIFVQHVMGISPTVSGSMLTPYTVLVAFMGIPVGFLLAKTGKTKWMYNLGYGIVTLSLFAMWRFTAHTPAWLYVAVTTAAGFGLGAIPTLNTLVAQYAVPQHLLGAAVGAMFFFQMVGISIAPAILGMAQHLASDLEGGLKMVFLAGALAMTAALLLINTIPEVSMDSESNFSIENQNQGG